MVAIVSGVVFVLGLQGQADESSAPPWQDSVRRLLCIFKSFRNLIADSFVAKVVTVSQPEII